MSLIQPKSVLAVSVFLIVSLWPSAWAQLNSGMNNSNTSALGSSNLNCTAGSAGCGGISNTPTTVSGSTGTTIGTSTGANNTPYGSATSLSALPNGPQTFSGSSGAVGGTPNVTTAPTASILGAGSTIGMPANTPINNQAGIAAPVGAGSPNYGGLGGYSAGAPGAINTTSPGVNTGAGTSLGGAVGGHR